MFQPGVEDGVGTTQDPFGADLTTGRMKQGEQFGRPVADIFVGLTDRFTGRLPTDAQMGYRLERASLIHAPHRQTPLCRDLGGFFDEVFFAMASGSTTSTTPALRFRLTLPVSHQVRSRCQDQFAWCKVSQMV